MNIYIPIEWVFEIPHWGWPLIGYGVVWTVMFFLPRRFWKWAAELPHYSRRTVDWHMGDLEVAGCSLRTDFPGLEVTEIAIGLDRLVAMRGS